MDTIVCKGATGWGAKTLLDFNAAKRQKLTIRTYKSRKGLMTDATVAVHKDGFESHSIFAEYFERVALAAVRCTEKSVRAQHAEVLAKADAILAEAREFYRTATYPSGRALYVTKAY